MRSDPKICDTYAANAYHALRSTGFHVRAYALRAVLSTAEPIDLEVSITHAACTPLRLSSS